MNHTFTKIREVVSSVIQIKIDGFSIAKANMKTDTNSFKSTCNVDGHDWEIRFLGDRNYPGLELVFLGDSRTSLTAVLSVKVVTNQQSSYDDSLPLKENKTMPKAFHRRLDRSLPIYIVPRDTTRAGYFETCSSLTLECTVTVFREPAQSEGAIPVPSSNLTQHLGELLHSKDAADVTFSVEGESFAAHKSVLAARSPVFMADFFVERKVENFQRVEIQDMDVTVFKAMLGFIYTDAVPELDEKPEAAETMAFAENLLIAAVRYGLYRLQVMCESRLALAMDASTLASTLSLAEQQNCSRLNAQCIEFIAGGSPENLVAVLLTVGYKHLAANSPLIMTELLKAAHGKRCTCSCNPPLTDVSHEKRLKILWSAMAAKVRTVKHTFTQLTEGVQSVYLLKIDGFSVTKATIGNNTNCIKSRCTVDGYDLEIRFYPAQCHHKDVYLLALELAFLGKACTQGVEASLRGQLVECQSSGVAPSQWKAVSKMFKQPSDYTSPIYIGTWKATDSQEPASLTVECTITVFRDLKAIRVPSSDLHQQLDELFNSLAGADVKFTVCGESFFAHKNILAARSPVFKAEFYGEMREKTSWCIEIKDMEAQVFKAMLHFIYTDMMPRVFDNQKESVHGTAMAQHLLVAADRYGLDRLKVMSEHRLSLSIGTETVASTLTLAEQFNCSHLKAKCIEFITGGSRKQLDAVLETEGYRNLEVSSPSVLTEIIKATHRNKRSRSTDS